MRGRLDTVIDGVLRAWAWDPTRPTERLTTRVVVDGELIGSSRADQLRKDLQTAGIGDGQHSTRYALPSEVQDGRHHDFILEVDGANGAIAVDQRNFFVPQVIESIRGRFEGFDRGACLGWAWDPRSPDAPLMVEIVLDGEVIVAGIADRPRQDLAAAGIGGGAHGFRLTLPLHIWNKAHVNAILTLRTAASETEPPFLIGTTPLPAPETTKALIVQARRLEQEGDAAGAISALDEVIRFSPNNVEALWRRARLAVAQGDVEKGRRLAERAMHFHSGHSGAAVILGRIAYDEGRHEESVAYWRRVPSTDNAFREGLMKTCRSLKHLGRTLEIIKPALAALQLRADDHDTRRLLAESLSAVGASDLALHHWTILASALPADRRHTRGLAASEGRRGAAAPYDPYAGLGVLVNPTLALWHGSAAGEVEGETELTEGLILRPLGRDKATVGYAVVDPREFRSGDLPHYGIRLDGTTSGYELLHRLREDAGDILSAGLVLSFDLRLVNGPAEGVSAAVGLLWRRPAGVTNWRPLWAGNAGSGPRMVRFDLTLSPLEANRALKGELFIGLRVMQPAAIVWHPVRPMRRLAPAAKSVSSMEGPAVGDQIRALRLRARSLPP